MRVKQIKIILFIMAFMALGLTSQAQYNTNYRNTDVIHQDDLSSFKKPAQYRRVLMIQNKSPEARALAIKANNWRRASNITYGIAAAGFLTSVVMANNALTDVQTGQAIGVGASSLIAATLGFFFHSFYTHNLYKAIEVYVNANPESTDPSEITLQLSVSLQLGN